MKVGIGYDIHPLVKERKLVLGGLEIDFPRGLSGHSDADVLTHAVCDALLGAAGEGDLGRHFPDSDERYRGISSLKLLEEVKRKIGEKGFEIENIDATVILQEPRLRPYIHRMVKKLAATLRIEVDRVNIKATTNEGLDAIGRGEAIATLAIASLKNMEESKLKFLRRPDSIGPEKKFYGPEKSQGEIRSQPDRLSSHRECPNRSFQLPLC